MKRYECIVCGWIYDEELGCPKKASLLAPNGMMYQTIGFALSAVWVN